MRVTALSRSHRERRGSAGVLWGCALGAAWLLSGDVGAQQQPRPAAPAATSAPAAGAPPAPVAAAPRLERAAVARVADTLARELARVPGRSLVASGPLVTDAQAPRAAQLLATLVNQVAGRRGARARVEVTTLPAARIAARSDVTLVFLSPEIAGGELRVSADVYPMPKSVWARIRDPEPPPMGHAFAKAPIDAEVRSFLAPIPLVTARVDRGKNFESDVVALACGDLDDDGSLEIVSVSRRRVTTLRLRGGRVSPLASRNWPDLVGVAPAPLREPIAFATIAPRPLPGGFASFLDIGLSDRAKSVRLDRELRVSQAFPGMALPDGDSTACTRYGGLLVTGPVSACVPGDALPYTASVGGRYDAFASARLVSPRGEPFVVWAGRERDVLELRDDAGRHMLFDHVGAQVAVGDLDQDGDPEVVTTVDTANALEDAVIVRTWPRATPNKLRDQLRIPAAAGVRAVAVCPPDGPGRAPLLVATADEIWVVR
jgi:hypothetical protein